ncbi:MAG: glucose-6-phosphate isomerase [Pseudomonadales bacterium]|jgi:glucose-6-phosphate isomerase
MFLKQLQQLAEHAGDECVATLCQDPQRFSQFKTSAAELTLDTSRQRMSADTFSKLAELANSSGFNQAFQDMRQGEEINFTEGRAVLHTLLRNLNSEDPRAEEVRTSLAKMQTLTKAVQSGEWKGYGGKTIRDVVNIGIGGSDLGPRMIYRAMLHYRHDAINVHWVANIDPADIEKKLAALNPETTLIVVSSKSFSTPETLNNANTARKWLLDNGVTDVSKHVVAASSNVKMALEFGIGESNIFPLWDWVGGRFSLWSAIGLPLMMGFKPGVFEAILGGALAMDDHAESAPLETNLPAQLALFELWNVNAHGTSSRAVLPYCHDLRLLPAHLQQLEMESLGKSVNLKGERVDYPTGGVVWGTEGSNGQHSYHQLLHQGNQGIAAEIILPLSSPNEPVQYLKLIANALAQSQVFCYGQSAAEAKEALLARGMADDQAEIIAQHKEILGNRPHSIITMESLNPHTLGALIAAYENKVFFCGYWQEINAFDQWGVELGKVHASTMETVLTSGDTAQVDGGYAAIVSAYLSAAK